MCSPKVGDGHDLHPVVAVVGTGWFLGREEEGHETCTWDAMVGSELTEGGDEIDLCGG